MFRATYVPDGSEVAVKVPHDPADLHATAVLREAFLREAHIHYKLLHPNVVTMIGGVCVFTFILYVRASTDSLTHSLSLVLQSRLSFSQFHSFLLSNSLSVSASHTLSLSFSLS